MLLHKPCLQSPLPGDEGWAGREDELGRGYSTFRFHEGIVCETENETQKLRAECTFSPHIWDPYCLSTQQELCSYVAAT